MILDVVIFIKIYINEHFKIRRFNVYNLISVILEGYYLYIERYKAREDMKSDVERMRRETLEK